MHIQPINASKEYIHIYKAFVTLCKYEIDGDSQVLFKYVDIFKYASNSARYVVASSCLEQY